MQTLQRSQSEKRNNDIAVGDKVKIANRFFDNRGLARVDLGVGDVVKQMAEDHKVVIVLKFNPVMLQYSINGYLKLDGFVAGAIAHVRIIVHLAYVEKFTQKRKRR